MKTQNTTKHTPGPWIVAGDSISGFKVMGDMRGHVGTDVAPKVLFGNDAYLIAAAPEMLRLLQKIQEEFAAGRTLGIQPGTTFALDVRDVVAKAEGRE